MTDGWAGPARDPRPDQTPPDLMGGLGGLGLSVCLSVCLGARAQARPEVAQRQTDRQGRARVTRQPPCCNVVAVVTSPLLLLLLLCRGQKLETEEK